MLSHAGGARFAYNVMLAAVKANLDQRAAERSYGIAEDDLTPCMSWSFVSLRNDWNQRKHTVAVRADGTPWWPGNSKEVYANACRALADALSHWADSRKGARKGPRMGFPHFKTKTRAVKKFSFTTGTIRVDPDRHHITLPRLGTIKTLAVKNMMAGGGAGKRGLNRALGDAGLGVLLRQLDYKTGWYGSRVLKADRWFPSSKLCSGCGVVKAKLHLAERTYECDSCGLTIDRDLNAAVNLARYAQRETDPSTGVVTGGADRKPPPTGGAGGRETRTRAEVGDNADDGGSASPKGEAA